MEKTDLIKLYKQDYQAKSNPVLLEIEEGNYLSIVGKGDPDGKEFAEKTQALFTIAYGIKAVCKKQGQDFIVSKLEGLWWVEGDLPPLKTPRSEWHWKLLIRMPTYVTSEQYQQAVEDVYRKKQLDLVRQVSLGKLNEGKVVQVLHTGPYANEPITLEKIEAFIQSKGLRYNGHHHEIYLSDFRKTAPDKLKTILRQPVI